MESYRKDAEQHSALLAFNCEVVGGNISGLSGQQTLVLHLTGLLHARTGMHGHDHVAIVRSGNLPEDSQRQQHLLYAPLHVQRTLAAGATFCCCQKHAAALNTTMRCCKGVTLHHVAVHAGLLSLCVTDDLAYHFKQLTTAALCSFGSDGALVSSRQDEEA